MKNLDIPAIEHNLRGYAFKLYITKPKNNLLKFFFDYSVFIFRNALFYQIFVNLFLLLYFKYNVIDYLNSKVNQFKKFSNNTYFLICLIVAMFELHIILSHAVFYFCFFAKKVKLANKQKTNTHAQTLTHTRASAHTHIHTYTYNRTHTYTHSHTKFYVRSIVCVWVCVGVGE